MSSAPENGRSRSCCIWLLTCFFFLVLIAGGTLLALYVTLPESQDTAWFPFAAMILVAIPWLFWILTWVYRSISVPRAADIERSPVRAAAAPAVSCTAPVATATDAGDSTAPTESTANDESSLKSNESERPLRTN